MEITFNKLWGTIQIYLRENGMRSLYSEAIEIEKGEITEKEVVAYCKTEGNLLARGESKKIIEDIIYGELLKELSFRIVVDKSEEEKINKLKKMFGSILEIV